MKNYIRSLYLFALSFIMISCLSYDNYDAPNATLQGSVTDLNGNPLYVESGDGIRIKLMDYGWNDNPEEQYLKVKMDGTYINTKLFASTYDIVAEGPFIPLVQTDSKGNIIVDKTQKGVKVKGTTTINFSVEPFLKVAWEGEPTFENGIMTTNFKITRGTDDPNWQLELYDVALFVSTTQYVGENNYDDRISIKESDKTRATAMLNTVSSLTTKNTYPMLPNHTYYVRVGARINYSFGFGAGYLYNYSESKKVIVPQY